jgi:hypothetical protein
MSAVKRLALSFVRVFLLGLDERLRVWQRLALFFVRLVVLYALLIAPWPGLRAGYAGLFRAGTAVLFGSFGSDGQVQVEPLPDGEGGNDVRLLCGNRRVPGVYARASCNSVLAGYFPTAFVVALVLATPLPWSRRWKALLWGLLLINAFVAGRVAVILVQVFDGDHDVALYQMSDFWRSVVDEVAANLVLAPASHFVLPLLVWIVVSLRGSDVEAFLASRTSGSGGAGKAAKERPGRGETRGAE